MFNRFDDSIGGRCAGDEGRSDHFHRLVMRTVHMHAGTLDDSTEQAARFDGDTVGYLICRWDLPMLQRLGDLRGNILVETPATGKFIVCMPPQMARVGMLPRRAKRMRLNSKSDRRSATTGKVYRCRSPYREGFKSGPLPVKRSPSIP